MADKIEFFAAGIPKAQPRPRSFFNKATGKARVYDPSTAENWKSCIAVAAQPHKPLAPLEGPIRCDITWYLPRPKRLCRKCDNPGPIWFTAKPDRDNLDKATLDALTMLGFWHDDAQACCGLISKFYAAMPGQPQSQTGAFITIERLGAI